MQLQPTSNIAIFGAGPIGITTACALKAAYPDLNITVMDRRVQPTRTHGLSIDANSVAKINDVLDKTLGSGQSSPQINGLKSIFKEWDGHFVRTNDIETTLGEYAKTLGITVLRDPSYGLAEGDLKAILDPANQNELTDKQKKLAPIIRSASLVFAADGAKSATRKELGIALTDAETLKYMVELKYQTNGIMQPQHITGKIYDSVKTGHIAVETVNHRTTEESKPATFLVFVDKPTYKKMRVQDGDKGLKGVYGNTWNLKDVENLSKTDSGIKNVHRALTQYISGVNKRQGACLNEQIATLKLKIYRSQDAVKTFHDKQIVLIGDANSGLVLQRGFNKGLQEVALSVTAVGKMLTSTTEQQAMPVELIKTYGTTFGKYLPETVQKHVMEYAHEKQNIPSALLEYEVGCQQLFMQERAGIHLKDKGIALAQQVVQSTASSFRKIDKISTKSNATLEKVNDEMKKMGMGDAFSKTVNTFFSFINKVVTWMASGLSALGSKISSYFQKKSVKSPQQQNN